MGKIIAIAVIAEKYHTLSKHIVQDVIYGM